jgi:hypothetical protein
MGPFCYPEPLSAAARTRLLVQSGVHPRPRRSPISSCRGWGVHPHHHPRLNRADLPGIGDHPHPPGPFPDISSSHGGFRALTGPVRSWPLEVYYPQWHWQRGFTASQRAVRFKTASGRPPSIRGSSAVWVVPSLKLLPPPKKTASGVYTSR